MPSDAEIEAVARVLCDWWVGCDDPSGWSPLAERIIKAAAAVSLPEEPAEPKRHRIELQADLRYGVAWELTCPADPTDESRSCWPHDENGHRFNAEEGAALGCNLLSWWDELGPEMVVSMPLLRFPIIEADWTGDGFNLFLGVPVSQEPPKEEA